jgi:hypothetical protein
MAAAPPPPVFDPKRRTHGSSSTFPIWSQPRTAALAFPRPWRGNPGKRVRDRGIFSLGDAAFHGSTWHSAQRAVVSLAACPGDDRYLMNAATQVPSRWGARLPRVGANGDPVASAGRDAADDGMRYPISRADGRVRHSAARRISVAPPGTSSVARSGVACRSRSTTSEFARVQSGSPVLGVVGRCDGARCRESGRTQPVRSDRGHGPFARDRDEPLIDARGDDD